MRKFKVKELVDKIKGKKNKIYFKVSSISIFVLLLVIGIFSIKLKNSEIKELENKIAEIESKNTKVASIRENIKEISKYSAYEFNYTSIIHFSDSNTFKGFNIPLTGNNFIATIDGKMNIGINGDVLDISETKNSEEKVTNVILTIPHSEIQDNYTIQDSLKIYDKKDNIFNPVKITDYNELIVEAEENEKKKVMESDILQKSDERIQYLLTSYLQQAYGEDVKIEYKYPDSTQSSTFMND